MKAWKVYCVLSLVLLSLFLLAGGYPSVTIDGRQHIPGPITVDGNVLQWNNYINQVVTSATTEDFTLYVRTTGNDNNDCLTSGNACLTIQEAVDRVPRSIGHVVVIDIGTGDFDGAYLAGFKSVGTSPSFKIKGVLGQPTLTTGMPTGTATDGGTRDVIDAGQTWTVDELIGYLALVDSEYRVIYDNDATSFNVVAAYGGATTGKAYEILEQKTNIVTVEPVTGFGGLSFKWNLIQVAVEDIKFTGILIGVYNGYTVSPAEPERCRFDACTYAGYYCQDAFEEHTILHTAAMSCQKGFYMSQGSQIRDMSGSLAFDSTAEGFLLITLFGVVNLGEVAAISNGGKGIYALNFGLLESLYVHVAGNDTGIVTYGIGKVNFNTLIAKDNTSHGAHLNYSLFVDLDIATISGNGGWGIVVDENATGNRTVGSLLNAAGTITIENNTSGGILARNQSVVVLTNVDGTNTGAYGLELQTGSYATITSATGITGATGDATINDGITTLTWATHFNDNGDIAVNLDNGCRIERRD